VSPVTRRVQSRSYPWCFLLVSYYGVVLSPGSFSRQVMIHLLPWSQEDTCSSSYGRQAKEDTVVRRFRKGMRPEFSSCAMYSKLADRDEEGILRSIHYTRSSEFVNCLWQAPVSATYRAYRCEILALAGCTNLLVTGHGAGLLGGLESPWLHRSAVTQVHADLAEFKWIKHTGSISVNSWALPSDQLHLLCGHSGLLPVLISMTCSQKLQLPSLWCYNIEKSSNFPKWRPLGEKPKGIQSPGRNKGH